MTFDKIDIIILYSIELFEHNKNQTGKSKYEPRKVHWNHYIDSKSFFFLCWKLKH